MKYLDLAKLSGNLERRNARHIEEGVIAGSHIIIRQKGEKVYEKCFGTNGVNGERLSGNLTYRIASMTKPVTVLALLIEAEKGNADISAPITEFVYGYRDLPVGRYINGKFTISGRSKTPITVKHLFSHTSGVEAGDIVTEFTAKMKESDKRSLKSVVEYFSDKPLFFETGTAQCYSPHVAFDIGARITETVSGTDFASYVKKNITDVIGMKDTTFTPAEAQVKRLAKMVSFDDEGKLINAPDDKAHIYGDNPVSYYCGGAGLMSTAEDYSAFAETLLRGGVAPNGRRVIGEKFLKYMYAPCCPISFMDAGTQKTGVTWGLGVRVFTTEGGKLPRGTFGWSGAYGTHFWVDPVNEITAVYMRNSLKNGGAGSMTGESFEDDVMASFR